MILRQTQNKEDIFNLLSDPELFKRVAEDGVIFGGFDFEIGSDIYFIIEVEDVPIGYWLLHPDNGSSTTLMIHAHILKQHRKHAYDAGCQIISWFINGNDDNIQKLVAEIPVIYQDVYHFTKKFGFQNEGINRKSIMKGGELTDQYRLGITKSEAKTWAA